MDGRGVASGTQILPGKPLDFYACLVTPRVCLGPLSWYCTVIPGAICQLRSRENVRRCQKCHFRKPCDRYTNGDRYTCALGLRKDFICGITRIFVERGGVASILDSGSVLIMRLVPCGYLVRFYGSCDYLSPTCIVIGMFRRSDPKSHTQGHQKPTCPTVYKPA